MQGGSVYNPKDRVIYLQFGSVYNTGEQGGSVYSQKDKVIYLQQSGSVYNTGDRVDLCTTQRTGDSVYNTG